ncbi:6788_t:CDS:2, partial [Scutellospora calospora]
YLWAPNTPAVKEKLCIDTEGAKVSVLGPVVGESIARLLLGESWKTK